MSDLERLLSIKEKILSKLDDMATNPRPDYSVDGQSVSYQAFQQGLFEMLKNVNEQIQASQPYFEVISLQ